MHEIFSVQIGGPQNCSVSHVRAFFGTRNCERTVILERVVSGEIHLVDDRFDMQKDGIGWNLASKSLDSDPAHNGTHTGRHEPQSSA